MPLPCDPAILAVSFNGLCFPPAPGDHSQSGVQLTVQAGLAALAELANLREALSAGWGMPRPCKLWGFLQALNLWGKGGGRFVCAHGVRCGSLLDWGSHTFPQQGYLALARPYRKQMKTPSDHCWTQTFHGNSGSQPRRRGREMLGKRALGLTGKPMFLWEGSNCELLGVQSRYS